MSKLVAGRTFPYILKDYRTEGAEPQFEIRVLSGVQDDEIRDLRRRYIDAKDNPASRTESLNQMLEKSVASAKCVGSVSELRTLLTDLECWELINAATEGATLSAEQRKKYVSPLTSETN